MIPEGTRGPGFKGSSESPVCELETQILLTGSLGFIEKSESGTAKKDMSEIERMLKTLINSLENKHLNP